MIANQQLYLARSAYVVVSVCAAIAASAVALLLPLLGDLPVIAALLAGLIYLISHFLRALRLALLSMDLLRISGRTTALMHFAITPLALALPFKTGELLRLHQLWRLSRTAIYALIVLLIDRMYDSLFLVPVLLALLMQNAAPTVLTLLTLLAAALPLIVVVVGPKLLTQVQRYVLVNHNNPRTLGVLGQIDALRILVTRAADVARKRAPELCLLSFLIRLSEFLFCLIIVNALIRTPMSTDGQALELLGVRLVEPWWNLAAHPAAGTAFALAAIAILLPWPVAVFFHLRRRKAEPTRIPAAWTSDIKVTP